MKNKFRWLIAAVFCISLTGCLIPEKFSTSMNVNLDGTYDLIYEGTAVFAPAIMQIKQSGVPLSARDEANLKAQGVQASREPGIKLTYTGNARYDVDIHQSLKIGQRAPLDIFSTSKDRNGVVTITSVPLKPDDIAQLKQLGIAINGTLDVKLPSGAKVIAQNANKTPGLFDHAYEWQIGDVAQRPFIQFKLS